MVSAFPQIGFLTSISPLVGGFTLLAYLLTIIRGKKVIQPLPFSFTFAIGWFLISIFIGQYFFNIIHGRNWLLTYVELVVMVWLIVQMVKTEQDLELLMKITLGVFFISSVYGLSQYNLQSGVYTEASRVAGLTGNANEFAFYASIGLIFCIYFMESSAKKYSLLITGMMVVFIGAIFFSGSRGGVIFAAVSLLYIFARRGAFKAQSIGYLLLIVAALAIIWLVLPAALQARMLDIPNTIINGDDTVGLRYKFWNAAMDLFYKAPLFGVGNGGFVYYNTLLNLVPGYSIFVAHNMYVQALAENGVFGTLPFLIILVLPCVYYLRAEKNGVGNRKTVRLAIVWEAVLLFLLLAGVKGSIEHYKVLWWAIGVSIPLYSISGSRSAQASRETSLNRNLAQERPFF
jgi:O-antigen ligase